MLHWIALLPGVSRPLECPPERHLEPADGPDPGIADTPDGSLASWAALDAMHLGWWGLQFTPRVALLEGAVVLEVQASERLFGGETALRERIVREALGVPTRPDGQTDQAKPAQGGLGIEAWAHAGTALAAVALARCALGRQAGVSAQAEARARASKHPIDSLQALLNPLPLHVLPGVAEHQPTLARLGCQTLAQVRQLPRGGLSRRFGACLLQALDQAYGLRHEAFDWLTLPPVFDARLELPGRVESAPALLFAANRLLQQLCAWLAGRHAGVTAFTLRWLHDGQRRDASREGEWAIRLGSPSRDMTRLSRLLAEHLQRIQLVAPVGEISLHADAIDSLPPSSYNLFNEHGADHLSAQPDALITPAAQRAQRDALLALIDKLSVRLGPQRVLQGCVQADHRLECAQGWSPATQALPKRSAGGPAGTSARTSEGTSSSTAAKATARTPALAPPQARLHAWPLPDMPQPCWVLPEPLPLALARDGPGLRERPLYQGKLQLLAGPHRIEAGWWDSASGHESVARDYYLASSEHVGLLWIFKARHAPTDQRSPWYLHGFFA